MKKKTQGIVLITTMLLLSFIIMIATLLVVTGRNSMKLGASYRERENAFYAAESGLAYAQRLINATADWTAQDAYAPGGASGLSFLSGNSGLAVSKISGTSTYNAVHGIIGETGGEFFVAFCNGNESIGSILPTAPIYYGGKPLRYYSVNSFAQTGTLYSYEWDGTQFRQFREVPSSMVHIIVEGRCGKVVRYVEAFLVQGVSSGVNAPIVAGKGIDVSVADDQYKFLVTDKYRTGTNLRAVEGINVHVGNVQETNGNYILKIDRGMAITGNGTNSGTRVNMQNVDSSLTSYWTFGCRADKIATGDQQNLIQSVDPYINWETVTNNYLSGGNEYKNTVGDKLLAGTYVYLEDNTTDGKYKLAYVPYKPDIANDTNYSDFMTKLNNGFFAGNITYYNDTNWKSDGNAIFSGSSNNVGFYFTSKSGYEVDWKDLKDHYLISVQNSALGIEPCNVYTQAGGNVPEAGYGFYTLVADYSSSGNSYHLSNSARARVGLTGDDNAHAAIVTTNGGDVSIEGELSGSGDILSSGNIIFQGESQLSPRGTEGLTIYSKGNIDLKEITGADAQTDINNIIKCAYYGYYKSCNGTSTSTKLSDIVSKILGVTLGNDTSGWSYHSSVSNNCTGDYKWYNGKNPDNYQNQSLSKSLDGGWGIKGKDAEALVYSYLARNYNEIRVNGHLKGYNLTPTNSVRELSFSDSLVKGLVFAEKNFNAALQGGSLSITGALIAYGADPASDSLPGSDGGNISIKDGKYVTVCYDPDFLDALIMGGVGGIPTKRVFWTSWSP